MKGYPWVQVGADMLCGNRVRKIVKVYKTGNFTVDGMESQFHPFHDGSARSTGSGWHANFIHLSTPERLALRDARVKLANDRDRITKFVQSFPRIVPADEVSKYLAGIEAFEAAFDLAETAKETGQGQGQDAQGEVPVTGDTGEGFDRA